MKRAVGVALLLALAGSARAEVRQSSPDAFFLAFGSPVSATPAKAYAAIAQPQRWWSADHTWSGAAANLSLAPQAGGCFCERWKDGSVEHGRVVMALPDKLLRLETALGPLQEYALEGILSFWIRTGDDGGTRLELEYRVNGASTSGLDAFAPKVDAVLGAQFERLVRYIDSGNPEAPQPATVAPAPDADAARAALLEQWKRDAEGTRAKAVGKPAKPEPPAPPVPA